MQQSVSSPVETWQLPVSGSPVAYGQAVLGRKSLVDRRNADTSALAMGECLRRIALEQDTAAFEAVFRHFAPRIKSYLLKVGADAATAEEVMQETLVAVWRKAGHFDPAKASASTWIFTIARNLRIDAFRRERRPELDPDDPALTPEGPEAPDARILAEQTAATVNAALESLSSAEQEILRMAYFQDKAQTAISEQMGIPLGTVKSRVRRAFVKLREALGESIGE
jgi:RNA polymerase sigma-70 factor (ECF subfamily)